MAILHVCFKYLLLLIPKHTNFQDLLPEWNTRDFQDFIISQLKLGLVNVVNEGRKVIRGLKFRDHKVLKEFAPTDKLDVLYKLYSATAQKSGPDQVPEKEKSSRRGKQSSFQEKDPMFLSLQSIAEVTNDPAHNQQQAKKESKNQHNKQGHASSIPTSRSRQPRDCELCNSCCHVDGAIGNNYGMLAWNQQMWHLQRGITQGLLLSQQGFFADTISCEHPGHDDNENTEDSAWIEVL